MQKATQIPAGIIIIIGFHILNILMWTIGQGGAIIDYDMVAQWGLQESRELLDPAVIAINQGIGLADMLTMIPFFAVAAIGLWRLKRYGAIASWIVLGWTIYWPAVFWSSLYFYEQAGIKHQTSTLPSNLFIALFPVVAIWACWYLFQHWQQFR